MNFHVLTLFPEMIEQGVNTSITGRAINNGLLSINAVNIRDYAFNKHNLSLIHISQQHWHNPGIWI